MRPEYSTWRFSFTILPYYSTALIISETFHILSSINVNEMVSHWVLFYCTLILFLLGRLRPKHVAENHLIVIIASCLIYVVYWRCIIFYRNISFEILSSRNFVKTETVSYHSFISIPALKARLGRNQSPVMWPVWLWHTASWGSSWG